MFGFLRETATAAVKAGKDPEYGICRTGLDDYLKMIFPYTNDWIHDKPIGGTDKSISRKRPDYRSESLKMIVEFDGLPHYQKVDQHWKDVETARLYAKAGYKVVRIPWFIQLTPKVIKKLFGPEYINDDVDGFQFDYASFTEIYPLDLSLLGMVRMYKELLYLAPEQLKINHDYLVEKEKRLGRSLGSKFLEEKYFLKLLNIIF